MRISQERSRIPWSYRHARRNQTQPKEDFLYRKQQKGLLGYYRRFIKNFARITKPFTTKKRALRLNTQTNSADPSNSVRTFYVTIRFYNTQTLRNPLYSPQMHRISPLEQYRVKEI
jgi:hypothetical protein